MKYFFFSLLDQTHLAKEKARADADLYKAKQEAEANGVSWSHSL